MIVTRGLGKGGSKFGALVSYGLSIDYISGLGFLAEVDTQALTLLKYNPAATWDASVFLFLPKAELRLYPEISVIKTENWLNRTPTANLIFNNYGLHPLVKTTNNIWAKPTEYSLTLIKQTPTSNATAGFIARVDRKDLSLGSTSLSSSITMGYLSRITTKGISLFASVSTLISDHKKISIPTKTLSITTPFSSKVTANITSKVPTSTLSLSGISPIISGVGHVIIPVDTKYLYLKESAGPAVITGSYLIQPPNKVITLNNGTLTLKTSNNFLSKFAVRDLSIQLQSINSKVSNNALAIVSPKELSISAKGLAKVSDLKKVSINPAAIQCSINNMLVEVTGNYFSKPNSKSVSVSETLTSVSITENRLIRVPSVGISLGKTSPELAWAFTSKPQGIELKISPEIAEVVFGLKRRRGVTEDTGTKTSISKDLLESLGVNKETAHEIIPLEVVKPSRVIDESNSSMINSSTPDKIDVVIKAKSLIFSNKSKRINVR